jgi:hypothetical protein
MDDVLDKINELPRYNDEYFTNSPVKQSQNRLSTINEQKKRSSSPEQKLVTNRRIPRRSTKNVY